VRDDQPVVLAVHIEELDLERLADERLGRVLARQVVRAGQEGAEALDLDDCATAVDGGHDALDGGVGGHHLRDGVPGLDGEDLAAREHLLPVLVLARDDQELVRSAKLQRVLGAGGLLERALSQCAVGRRLDADVDERAVGLEPEHGARHRLAAREGGDVAHARLQVGIGEARRLLQSLLRRPAPVGLVHVPVAGAHPLHLGHLPWNRDRLIRGHRRLRHTTPQAAHHPAVLHAPLGASRSHNGGRRSVRHDALRRRPGRWARQRGEG